MMATTAPSAFNNPLNSLSSSRTPSQSSSPTSPTGPFFSQLSKPSPAGVSSLRTSSRPGTPVRDSANSMESPPPGMPYSQFVRSWTDQHVSRWLADVKCSNHATTFRSNDIRGDVILDLDQQTLKEMGINSIGDRLRIINAVKVLRQRCSSKALSVPSSTTTLHHGSPNGRVSPQVTVNGEDHRDVEPPNNELSRSPPRSEIHQHDTSTSHRHRGRPAPLQLQNAQQAGLPRLIRDNQPQPESARSTAPAIRPLPQQPTQQQQQQQVASALASSATSATSSSSGSGGSLRSALPPLPPPPRSQPPLPPINPRQPARIHALTTQQHSGRRTPTQSDAPHYTSQPLPPAPPGPAAPGQQQQLHTPSTATTPSITGGGQGGGPWKGEYGLPSGPRPGNLGGGQTPGRSTSPLPRGSPGGAGHLKTSSYGGSTSTSAKAQTRPGPGGQAGSSHPYALQPPPTSTTHNLSPIQEHFLGSSAAGRASPPTSLSASLNPNSNSNTSNAYSVGRGAFVNRPTTPSHSSALSLEDLRRKLVKFKMPDDGQTVTINIPDGAGGVEVLERALKKFNKLGSRSGDVEFETDDGGLCVDGWAVYLDYNDGQGKPLRESELLAVCHAGSDHPAREQGLTLRRIGKAKRSKALQQIFGEELPPQAGVLGFGILPASPNSPLFAPGPRLATGDEFEDADGNLMSPPHGKMTFAPNPNAMSLGMDTKAMKRASSISVLSALGVAHPERVLEPPVSRGSGSGSGSAHTSGHTSDNSPPPTAVPQIYTQSPPPAPPMGAGGSGKSPSASTFAGKIRQFLARPPSEVITNHLTEFFPYTERKVLQKTARQSMMRVSGMGFGRRESGASWKGSRFSSSTDGGRDPRASMSPNRVSMASLGSMNSMASLPPPPVPEKGTSMQGRMGDGSGAASAGASPDPPRLSLSTEDGLSVDMDGCKPTHLLPPVKFPTDSFSDALDKVNGARSGPIPSLSRTTSTASRRTSYMTELRSKRDISDTASMITVDEITAEVESRRKSMAGDSLRSDTLDGDTAIDDIGEDDSGVPARLRRKSGVRRSSEMLVDDELDEEDEELFEEELEDEEEEEDTLLDDEEDDEPGKAVTSTGGKRAIKWIRGALIGAGSFGSVYLGMEAASGLLMAVKQVELPSGSGPNEERKKSMLSALEREIDLLKDLQHENIVQYLDSSSDEDHLNIFLEYVPGGSVTALLRNYGAFEEALVRNFVRQILTGLNYLHEREIIHRDIKGANILVDNKGGIKISDFGISKKVEDNLLGGARLHRPSLQGSVFWMAPEVVKQTSYTRKADIWSVGCLVVEMLTGQHPWAQLTQMQAIFKIGSMAKPTIPSDISSDAVDFLQRTFEINHEARPSASELLQHPWIVKDPAATKSKALKAI